MCSKGTSLPIHFQCNTKYNPCHEWVILGNSQLFQRKLKVMTIWYSTFKWGKSGLTCGALPGTIESFSRPDVYFPMDVWSQVLADFSLLPTLFSSLLVRPWHGHFMLYALPTMPALAQQGRAVSSKLTSTRHGVGQALNVHSTAQSSSFSSWGRTSEMGSWRRAEDTHLSTHTSKEDVSLSLNELRGNRALLMEILFPTGSPVETHWLFRLFPQGWWLWCSLLHKGLWYMQQ